MLLKDTIAKYNSEGTPVYICSLDAEKAFDSCNWHQLFSKPLKNNTIPKLVIRFLINLNGEANTKYNGTISDTFKLTQGVRQGSILSPYLYNIYTEDLIERIQNLSIGTYLPPNLDATPLKIAVSTEFFPNFKALFTTH